MAIFLHHFKLKNVSRVNDFDRQLHASDVSRRDIIFSYRKEAYINKKKIQLCIIGFIGFTISHHDLSICTHGKHY